MTAQPVEDVEPFAENPPRRKRLALVVRDPSVGELQVEVLGEVWCKRCQGDIPEPFQVVEEAQEPFLVEGEDREILRALDIQDRGLDDFPGRVTFDLFDNLS